MATKTVGELIKEARTNAKLSQAALGEQVGVSAADIGKAERGEKELSQTVLKAIAKATGVTQKSLLEAPKAAASGTAKKTTTTAKKTTSTAAKKTAGSSAKKPASTAKTPAASSAAEELTAAEKTLLNAYRKADAETRKAALKLLKGEKDEDILSTLIQNFTGGGSGTGGDIGGTLMSLLGSFGKK